MPHSQACHPLSSFPHTHARTLPARSLTSVITKGHSVNGDRGSSTHTLFPSAPFHFLLSFFPLKALSFSLRVSDSDVSPLWGSLRLSYPVEKQLQQKVFTTERRGLWNWCCWTPFADFVFVVFNWFPLLCQWKKQNKTDIHYIICLCIMYSRCVTNRWHVIVECLEEKCCDQNSTKTQQKQIYQKCFNGILHQRESRGLLCTEVRLDVYSKNHKSQIFVNGNEIPVIMRQLLTDLRTCVYWTKTLNFKI